MNTAISLSRPRHRDTLAPVQDHQAFGPPERSCRATNSAASAGSRADMASVMRFIASHIDSPADVDSGRIVLGNPTEISRGAAIRTFLQQYTMRVQGAPPFVVPFRMVQQGESLAATQRALIKQLGGDGAPATRVAGYALLGRARPDELRQLVAALAARHPERFTPPSDPRSYLRSLGVGIDCAGFVQLALAQLQGQTRPPFGLQDRGMENLSSLGSNPSFRRVASPVDARAGDVITLKRPEYENVGHAVIVTECATCPGSSLRSSRFDLQPDDRIVLIKVTSS